MDGIKTGIVFDIQRFALNDGPGIRTTVFLKGCPMECLWCHNPESQNFKPQLSFNAEKCINCFECANVCPSGVHQNINGKHEVIFDLCKLSGECIEVCPSGALKTIGIQSSVDEVISEVLKDLLYYKNSGGGLTISGGEPLAQYEFTKALLITAKVAGLHTCIDTCGLAKQKHYEEIFPYVDLFLFDYKATGSEVHRELTKVDNKLILRNLNFLLENNANVILRCPLMPGINDKREHLEAIGILADTYPMLKEIRILPYHSFGRDKAERIGMKSKTLDIPLPSDELKRDWMNIICLKVQSDPARIIME